MKFIADYSTALSYFFYCCIAYEVIDPGAKAQIPNMCFQKYFMSVYPPLPSERKTRPLPVGQIYNIYEAVSVISDVSQFSNLANVRPPWGGGGG